MADYYIKDVSKNWLPDEWIGYGVILAPSPRKIFPDDYVTSTNTKQISSLAYSGRGMSSEPDDGTGTYTTPNNSAKLFQDDYAVIILNGWKTSPHDKEKQLSIITSPSISSTTDQTVRIKTNDIYNVDIYPAVDYYFHPGDIGLSDIVGIKVYVQAAITDATVQPNGIKIEIYQHTGNGAGVWEELSNKTGTSRITVVEDGSGTFGVFEHTFELSDGGTDYIDLDQSDWEYYIYLHRKEDASDERRAVRIRIQGVDSLKNVAVGNGMYIGCVYIQLIRAGLEENFFEITDSGYQTLTVSSTSVLSNYYGENDIYVIAPSIQTIFDDFDDSTYGFSNYNLSFDDNTNEKKFISINPLGQTHIATLGFICDYGNYIWFEDGQVITLQKGGKSYLTDSGITFDNTVLCEDNSSISYPRDHLLKYVTIYGNSSLGLSYTATSSNNYTERGLTLTYQHITGIAELKTLAENILAKHEDLSPELKVDLYYDVSYYPIKIGTYVTVNYKTINDTLRVKRRVFRWEAGKGLRVTYYLGETESPPSIKIRDKINSLNDQLRFLQIQGAEINYKLSEETISPIYYGGASVEEGESSEYLRADGLVGLITDWDAGDYTILMKTLKIDNSQSYYSEFIATPTANRTYTFPDADAYIPAFSSTQAGEIINITPEEMQQIENINAETISNTQWAYLGALNQSLATTNSPTFAGASFTGQVNFAGGTTYKIDSSGNATFKQIIGKSTEGLHYVNQNDTNIRLYFGQHGASTQYMRIVPGF